MRLSTRKICLTAVSGLLLSAFLPVAGAAAPPAVSSSNGIASTYAFFGGQDGGGAAMPRSRGQNFGTPRVELFVGYSYLRGVPEPTAGNRLAWLNGGSTSIAYNFNRYLGLVGDFGGFNDTRLLLQGATPDVVVSSSGTVFTYMAGPRLSFRSHERFTPFAQALFGVAHASPVNYSSGCTGVGCTPLPSETKFAMTAGGGIDFRLTRHIAIRPIQAEYLMTSFENRTTGQDAHQNDMRLSAGLVFRFGGAPPVPPLPPVSYSCSANPSSVYRGEPVAVSGTLLNQNPAVTPTYTWSTDGGTIVGSSSTGSIDTSSATPGRYTVKGHATQGESASDNADCTATFVVKMYEPPTVSCTAAPTAVISGANSTITTIGISPQNRPLTYVYTSTAGTVTGSGASATLVTTGVPSGVVNVTCGVLDDKGQTASANTTVNVEVPAPAPKPMTSALCMVNFSRDARRPSRVDNEAKACLDQIALNLQNSSGARLALVGNAANDEKGGAKLAAARAVNTKEYLVSEKGIDTSRISVYTGSGDEKIVSTTLIPADATFDSMGDTAVQ